MHKAKPWQPRLYALALALLLLACSGCARVIQEDALSDGLPPIDPNAGVGKEYAVTLYYRLAGEPLLVPVQRTITVKSNEHAAKVIVQELIAGPAAYYTHLSGVLPAGTKVDASHEGGIIYITLSEDVITASNFQGFSREEQALSQQLGVYAIVNSLCAFSSSARVQIMVSTNGGEGTRVSPFQLGFSTEEMSSPLMEPMTTNEAYNYTPRKLIDRVFIRLMEKEYAQAYSLFAEMETGGMQKPADYATFETEMNMLGTIDGYTIHSVAEQDAAAPNGQASVSVLFTAQQDGIQRETHVNLLLMPEGEIFKAGYHSMRNAMLAAINGVTP